MQTKNLIENLRKAFGEKMKLPIAVWYSDAPAGEEISPKHCMFSMLPQVEAGVAVTLSKETLHCGGGRVYCGFNALPPGIPNFVSNVEHYKQTPELVGSFVASMDIALQEKPYVNFARIDQLETLDGIEGIVFLAEPDTIAGLWSWACFDHNSMQAVSCPFASGCAAFISLITTENRTRGRRTFLGMLDLSARPFVGCHEMSFAIPLCRLEEMAATLPECALMRSPAWERLRERIET